MYRVRQQDLPFQGSSHHFVGADNGDVNVSVFLLSALPGRGPGPHRHPYDEVQFVREIHSFRCIGDAALVQLDVHLSPRFVQENLT
jgi:hypothetical protein